MFTVNRKKRMKSMGLVAILLVALLTLREARGFGIEAKGLVKSYGQPIHESITLKAVIESGLLDKNDLLTGDELTDPEFARLKQHVIKHILEGARFNDDPEGYLLNGSESYNGFSPVLGFITQFIGFGKDKDLHDPTKASHFGQYQYLHAMGLPGMKPSEIRGKIDRFIFHCWRMATDDHSYEKFKQDYEVVTEQLKREADPNAGPSSFHYTPDQIIVRKSIELFPKSVLFLHSTDQLQFQYRALGAILHVIQDSYAKGHVVRVGWESGDNSGNIRYFQTYGEQDSNAHSDLDTLRGASISGDNFLQIPGARAAMARSKEFLNLVRDRCPWTRAGIEESSTCDQSVYGFIRNEVFAFDGADLEEAGATRSHPDLLPKLQEASSSMGGG